MKCAQNNSSKQYFSKIPFKIEKKETSLLNMEDKYK